MDLATAQLTVSPACLELAERLHAVAPADELRVGERLRRDGYEGALVAAAMTLAGLRREAQARLGAQATALALHRAGLEQATRASVAALHAQRFVDAACRHVADLTCGLGLDAGAIAARGIPVTAFESDGATATLAAHNLARRAGARVVHGDSLAGVTDLLVGDQAVDGIFADPARRNARGRTHDPADYSPRLDAVLELRHRVRALGVKVGPGIPHDAIPEDMEAQWVSVDGDVVEAGLWSGDAARGAGHAALVLAGDAAHELRGSTARGEAGPLGDYLLEPDGAVIRAGLVGELSHRLGAHLVDPTIAYLTVGALEPTPFARAYRVVEQLPLDVKRLAAALKARDVGVVDIKKRGVDVTPEQLRPRLKLKGARRETVVLTRIAGRHAALIVEPVGF